MLTANWIMPLVFCVGPVVLACAAVFLYKILGGPRETIREVVFDDWGNSVRDLGELRKEQDCSRAYSQVALCLPK